MCADTLDQHRRELDATYAALQATHATVGAAIDDGERQWESIAELRDELHALANRVENLTRIAALNGGSA